MQALAVAERKVRNDGAMLHGKAPLAWICAATLARHTIGSAWVAATSAAEVPDVPRRVADTRDGTQHFRISGQLGANQHRCAMGCRIGTSAMASKSGHAITGWIWLPSPLETGKPNRKPFREPAGPHPKLPAGCRQRW